MCLKLLGKIFLTWIFCLEPYSNLKELILCISLIKPIEQHLLNISLCRKLMKMKRMQSIQYIFFFKYKQLHLGRGGIELKIRHIEIII